VEEEKNDHIDLETYLKICREHRITREQDARTLSTYLHALGTIIHYKDDPVLRNTVILNPNWVVDALYTALSDADIQRNQGRFTKQWLFDLWQHPKDKEKCEYTETECHALLTLMKRDQFELCYALDDSDETHIYPALLRQQPPVYHIDFKGALHFQLSYPFLPLGLMSRLIVRLNDLLFETPQGAQVVWRDGALFTRGNSIAEVKSWFAKESGGGFDIRVKGDHYEQKELWAIIINEIERIHKKSFKNIEFNIAVPCYLCPDDEKPRLFPLDDLSKLAKHGEPTVTCPDCGNKPMINTLVGNIVPDHSKERSFVLDIRGGSDAVIDTEERRKRIETFRSWH